MININFTFLKIDSTEAIKDYAKKRLEKLDKYITYPCDIHFTFSVEKTQHKAEITCHAEHHDLVATAESENLYESIDATVHKIETQLKKERERRKDHVASPKAAQDLDLAYPHREKKI